MRATLALAFSAVVSMIGGVDRVTASVTVAGGPHAGSYYLRNTDEPCEIRAQRSPNPKHLFDVMVGGRVPNVDSTKLTALLVTIPDAEVIGENHSFFAFIIFGDIEHGTRYVIESRRGHAATGSGVVTVATRGHNATVMLEVVSSVGVAYRGTLLCTDLSRF